MTPLVVNEVMTTSSADQVAPSVAAPPKAWSSILVISVYVTSGIAAFWPVLPHISRRLFGVQADFTQSVWFLGWEHHALAQGLNPFFSNAMLVPTGVNLAQNTACPLLGLVTAPLALVFSPLVIANLLFVMAMPVSATAAYVVLRRWQVWCPAAALGGLIYGFSPYMVGQGLGHLGLMFVPLPPFIALTIASILERRGSPRRLGIQLGVLVAAQYLISPEVLAIVFILALAAVACIVVRQPSNLARLIRSASGPLVLAVTVAAVLLAYPLWMMLAGPQHVAGAPWPPENPYHNDLFSFVAPGPLQRISLGMRSLGTRVASGSGATEAGGYIGFPALVLTGILAWKSRRSARTQLAGVLLFLGALLSLGPHLTANGRLTHIPLPFLLLNHIPLLNSILPSRINLSVFACLAAMIAFGLDDMRRAPWPQHRPDHSGRTIRQGSTVFATLTLIVLLVTQLPQWPAQSPYVPRTASVLPPLLRDAIPAQNPITITYPFATLYDTGPLLWQVEAGFRFRLLGGYAYHPNVKGTLYPSTMSPPDLQQFLAGQDNLPPSLFGPTLPISPLLVANTRTALSKYDVRLIIVDASVSGSGPVISLFTDALGPPTISADRFSLWASN